MARPASIRKHPIHPLLVPLPIGLWVFSLVADVVYRYISSDSVWDEVAFYTMAGGLVGALLAAVPGFIDFLSLSGGQVKRIALTHMLLNLTVVGLFAVNMGKTLSGANGKDATTAQGASVPSSGPNGILRAR